MDHTEYKTTIGKTYCVSANLPSKVIAEINGQEITLLNISRGQGTFIAPCKNVRVTAGALVTPCFKGAALTAQEGGIKSVEEEYKTKKYPEIQLGTTLWFLLCSETEQVKLRSGIVNDEKNSLVSAHFLITPSKPLVNGWLTAEDGVSLLWLAGEPTMPQGYTYIVSILQISPDRVIANLSAVF